MRKLKSLFPIIALFCAYSVEADAIETKAQYAYMVDYDTGTTLYAKEPDVQMHPSSMSKLMTSYVIYSRIKEGRLKLTDTFPVSEKAWRMQGSKMFVHVGDEVKVEDLLRGIAIQSGNDACIVAAEGISGSEEAFAKEMNRIAAEIGLKNSHFVNATGWPDEGQMMSARDLATLAGRIIHDFPEFYPIYSEIEFTYSGIHQPNRNRLLHGTIGVDGLKTGHTEIAGYGITLSAKDPKTARRIILVINGVKSDNERVEEGDKLLRYGFREFETRTIVNAGETIESAPVWYGQAETVPLVAENEVKVTLPINASGITFAASYDSPVPAPVQKGAKLGELVITIPERDAVRVPLVAGKSVEKLGFFGRMTANLKHLISH